MVDARDLKFLDLNRAGSNPVVRTKGRHQMNRFIALSFLCGILQYVYEPSLFVSIPACFLGGFLLARYTT